VREGGRPRKSVDASDERILAICKRFQRGGTINICLGECPAASWTAGELSSLVAGGGREAPSTLMYMRMYARGAGKERKT